MAKPSTRIQGGTDTVLQQMLDISFAKESLINSALDAKADLVGGKVPYIQIHETIILMDGGDYTLSEDTPWLTIVKNDASAMPVVIAAQSGTTIEGAAIYSLSVQYESVHLALSGTTWIRR